RLRQAAGGNPAHELRPDGVADGEQEHEERKRLERLVHRDPDLPDHDGGDHGGGHRPEADSLVGELAEVVTEGEREKNRDFRVGLKRREEPVNHVMLRFWWCRLGVRILGVINFVRSVKRESAYFLTFFLAPPSFSGLMSFKPKAAW